MESETRFGKDVSPNNKPPEKPSRRSNLDAWHEVGWPLLSWTLGLRPLHMWDVGRRARIKEGQRVLEIGAGYPLWKIHSGRVGKTGTFIALDSNETISKRSRKITRLLNLGKERLSEQIITADAHNLPFRDESMDIIIVSNLNNPLTAEDVFKEAFRVLKPKGRLISAETGNPHPDIDILRKVGFTNIRQRPGTPFLVMLNWFVIASKPLPKDA